ncbi:MAG: glucokinase [Thermoanaerobaculia bacterium]
MAAVLEVLAGDVGATTTRLASYHRGPEGSLEEGVRRAYPSAEHSGLEALLRRFLAETGSRARHLCLGLPGPVRDGRCRITNLPWQVDAHELEATLGLDQVTLLNDLEAQAHALAALPPEALLELAPGAPEPRGNRALIAAGTGLGEAGLAWDGARHRPFATEGGHASFSPQSELEVTLLGFLARRHGHVSWERVLSGPGLAEIFEFLCEHRGEVPAAWFLEARDPAAALTERALAGTHARASEALELFVRLYGAEAGNLALKMLATGGLYVAGGIALKILPRLSQGGFLEGFLDKGRMRELLLTVPVRVVLHPLPGLLGAARVAFEQAAD